MKRLSIARLVCASLLAFYLSASAALASDRVDLSKLSMHFDSTKHTMYFNEPGWFKSTQYLVKYFNGSWHWQATDGNWNSLLTPFIARWNEKYYLILSAGGRIIVSMKDNSSNFEIKLINGTWYENAGYEWNPLDDMYN